MGRWLRARLFRHHKNVILGSPQLDNWVVQQVRRYLASANDFPSKIGELT
jgi:hypothetical protein